MIDLLLEKSFIVEEYEFQRVHDPKNKLEKPQKPDRHWKVSISGATIARGFLAKNDAEDYIRKSGNLALWNALWTKGIPISWDNRLFVNLNDFVITFKEM